MIGRFLEIGLQCEDVLASLEFYKTLGFRELDVGDIWTHPYAVVSDGRLHLGLHARELDSPTLTFVLADLAAKLPYLERNGVRFEFSQLDSDQFNTAGVLSPDQQLITLLEARTYSPAPFEELDVSTLGRLAEFRLRTKNAEAASGFWENIGLRVATRYEEPYPRVVLSAEDLVVGLHESHALRHPTLCFSNRWLNRTAEHLADADIDAMLCDPPVPEAGRAVTITSPEGMPIIIYEPAPA